MEKRLANRINDYIYVFKNELATQIKNIYDFDNNKELQSIVDFVYNYNKFSLDKDDFMKRKRVKNMVPNFERCCAKRANGDQCTRRKIDNSYYCGTHVKGTPHGIITDIEPINPCSYIELTAIDIKGIIYYLDQKGNVYNTEDVISNQKNPRIIAKYEKNGDEYSIPELFS